MCRPTTVVAVVAWIAGAALAVAQERLTTEEILKKIGELSPDAADFVFSKPAGWSANLMIGAGIVAVNDEESAASARTLIDQRPHTTWQSKAFTPRPEITIDLGAKKSFDRVVIFNRHTESRGTGGGNNAARRVEVLVCDEAEHGEFRSLATFTLVGPKELCFKKKGGGQICTFIDRATPNVLDVPPTSCRRLKLRFVDAFWSEALSEDQWSSVALSEILLFDSRDSTGSAVGRR